MAPSLECAQWSPPLVWPTIPLNMAKDTHRWVWPTAPVLEHCHPPVLEHGQHHPSISKANPSHPLSWRGAVPRCPLSPSPTPCGPKPVIILGQRDLLEVEVQAVAGGRLQQPVAGQVVAVVPGEAGGDHASHRGVTDSPAARRCGTGRGGQRVLGWHRPRPRAGLSHAPGLTHALGLAGAPEGPGGVAAGEQAGALQLVARGAAEPGVPAGVQAADRDVAESGPRWEGAAQQVGWGRVVVLQGRTDPLRTPTWGSRTQPSAPAPCTSVMLLMVLNEGVISRANYLSVSVPA